MKITVSRNRFEKEWESTGKMLQESPTTFVQTYSHKRFPSRYKQSGKNKLFDTIALEEVKL